MDSKYNLRPVVLKRQSYVEDTTVPDVPDPDDFEYIPLDVFLRAFKCDDLMDVYELMIRSLHNEIIPFEAIHNREILIHKADIDKIKVQLWVVNKYIYSPLRGILNNLSLFEKQLHLKQKVKRLNDHYIIYLSEDARTYGPCCNVRLFVGEKNGLYALGETQSFLDNMYLKPPYYIEYNY